MHVQGFAYFGALSIEMRYFFKLISSSCWCDLSLAVKLAKYTIDIYVAALLI